MRGVSLSTIHGRDGGRLALRAVVFDYGMVLTGPPDPVAHAALARITGLTPSRLDEIYWAIRPKNDRGTITAEEFWRQFAARAGLHLSRAQLDELNHWDVRMWTTQNPPMIAWQLALKQRGLLTAILSNMGDAVLAAVQREFSWLSRFDALVWSCQLGVVKPEPAIYRYALEKLGTRPEETLFLDDRPANVEAAIALGMRGLVFTTVDRLRAGLIAAGLDKELSLPESA
jgi:putative hydrolase of the HAD superfamily